MQIGWPTLNRPVRWSTIGLPAFSAIISIAILSCSRSGPAGIAPAFSTNGHTVYHLETGTVHKGSKSIITASIDGKVHCFTTRGGEEWEVGTRGGFPFDLCVEDFDRDGRDEVLVASGNGTLFAFDHDGKALWNFQRTLPLYRVSVARVADGRSVILAGGPEQVLYAISSGGRLIDSLRTEHCIRHIRTGNIMNDGSDYIAMTTTTGGLSGNLSLMLLNPTDLSIIWKKSNLGSWKANTGRRFFSLLLKDINHDGHDEILLTGGWGENGIVYAFDHNGENIFTASDPEIPNIPYRMNLLSYVSLPDDEFILGHFANRLIVYEPGGELRELLRGPFAFSDVCYDPDLKTLFLGSAVSGGDGVYALQLDRPGWQQDFESIQAVGRLTGIRENLTVLNRQIENFEPPGYQPDPQDVLVISRKPGNREYQHLAFVHTFRLSQEITDPDELWCMSKDRRCSYNTTLEEMIERVATMEAEGQDFLIWAGHGSAIYFPLSSFQKLIDAAPVHLRGFVFAEMESVGEHMQKVVHRIILPVAELCRKNGKHIVFRNKNIFWNGICYLPFWREVLLDARYSDVFIPALEETNCRTQELSLAGRIGLWQTGTFDRWACRTVTDNANFDRMFEWGGQQLLSHHLRNLVSTASMGADVFFNNIHGGPDTDSLYTQLIPFYEMLEKGILHIPKPDELLSVSGLAIGIKEPPSERYIRHGSNGHKYWFPSEGREDMVFGRLDTYFGGSSLDSFDYSWYAMNVKRRMTNFLPETPYGLTAIIDAQTGAGDRFDRIIVTDGQYFYDETGDTHSAVEYKPVVEDALLKASENLIIRVVGQVHWAASRLDPQHVRITLVDPGFLDPELRDAEIIFQHIEPSHCRDILSGENIPVHNGKVSLTVPAGVFRILDVEHN